MCRILLLAGGLEDPIFAGVAGCPPGSPSCNHARRRSTANVGAETGDAITLRAPTAIAAARILASTAARSMSAPSARRSCFEMQGKSVMAVVARYTLDDETMAETVPNVKLTLPPQTPNS